MPIGKKAERYSPILRAIAQAQAGTTGEVHVHLSRSWIERDAYARAQRLFAYFGMTSTPQRNAVLLYVNLRRRKFAVVGDTAIHERVGDRYWRELCTALQEDLRSTHAENAIALAVTTIGATLQLYFPAGGPSFKDRL